MSNFDVLLKKIGLQPTYQDAWGNEQRVSKDTLQHILTQLDLPTDNESAVAASLAKLSKHDAHPPVQIIPAYRQQRLPADGAIKWELTNETGEVQTDAVKRGQIILPPLLFGYYQLKIIAQDDSIHQTTLIVAPPKCWVPENIQKGKRVWGLAAQLYAMRSANNMGMGDFGDLIKLAKQSAELGVDVIGLNPVSSMFPDNPEHASPYSPSDRTFLNALYLDVTAIAGFDSAAVQTIWNAPEFQQQLTAARASELVDYSAVAYLKQQILAILFQQFQPDQAYIDFCQAQGERLQHKALFDALTEYFNEKNGRITYWREWPPEYQNHQSPESIAFAQGHAERIQYFCWLQYQADMQLAKAQNTARQGGMSIGLYRDLAVGSETNGAEFWLDPKAFISNVTVGVPADEFNPMGQNWGLPPFNPVYLRSNAYKPFIDLLRANMRHAHALRIDHAFGLLRLFLVPTGKESKEGAFLHYAFDEMLAVLRVESHLNQCIVIGEDLGVFPAGYKEDAEKAGVLSYKVFWFERDATGELKPPEHYPPLALATLSTHDLPTLRGWLHGKDLEERANLKLYPSNKLRDNEAATRKKDHQRFDECFGKDLSPEEQILSVHTHLGRSQAALVMVQLEDIFGVDTQINLPGTTDERPNWRRKLPVALEDFTAPDSMLLTLGEAMKPMRNQPLQDYPRATYRLQLHKDFTFYDAVKILPYLAQLGISHVYCSSYLKARPGSTHGYDITDHNALNPELGGQEGYDLFVQGLQANGLKQILDFVPNHMGVGGSDNHWWLNVLEWGQQSPYASYFDIDWQPRYVNTPPKLVLPFLGNHYGDVLEAGELELKFDPQHGSFNVWYHQHCFPICPADYHLIDREIQKIERDYQAGENLKATLLQQSSLHATLQKSVAALNKDHAQLHALLEHQAYRLSYWGVASSEINYRRFFDINDLAGLRVEDEAVFADIHRFVLAEIKAGRLHGLRIDHIDGLADPAAYCRRLRAQAGSSIYIVVEKILGAQEDLAKDWPIDGTSGYDALNQINAVFVAPESEAAFTRTYERFTGYNTPFEQMVYTAKSEILNNNLSSELQVLTLALKRLADNSPYTRDYPFVVLRQVLREIIAWFPVYRSYVAADDFAKSDAEMINWAINRAKKRSELVDKSVYDFISTLLAQENIAERQADYFVRKFQQLSGPAMAKGLEDTAFYRYNRLLSLNEVGGDPSRFGITAKTFHQIQTKRAEILPHSMLASATHDTKRGEDHRARILVLSEMPREWRQKLLKWAKLNRSYHVEVDGRTVPSRNEEYFIYQTLLGSWSLEFTQTPFAVATMDNYIERLKAYLVKALREAKEHTYWTMPNEAYETAIHKFIEKILDVSSSNLFLDDFVPFATMLATHGMQNSLAQTVLKLTLPGVPDIYQGTEFWDLSLVDPDNRRPVDYAARQKSLNENASDLLIHWHDGQIKQHLVHCLLQHRQANPALYTFGSYETITVDGSFLAFQRQWQKQKLTVIIPTRITDIAADEFQYFRNRSINIGEIILDIPELSLLVQCE